MSGIPAGAGSLLGKRLGKYEILALLALGGTAEIYLARIGGAAGFEKYVVIKCLHDHLADDEDFVKMFLDEARLAALLDHSNIVQTFELGEYENRYYMVMEFLAGLSLAMVVRRAGERLSGGRVPVPLILNVAAQAAAGLHYSHERTANGKPLNMVHRDISPQNLVISFEGVVKVVDFGIARAELRETKTKAGTIKGKFAYMSPEQCVASNVDRRTDVFALGVIVWELLTGRRLFKRTSPYETYQAVIECAVQPPSAVNHELDPALDVIVMKALAKDRGDRYPSAEAFGDALLGYLHHRGKASGPAELGRFMEEHFAQEVEEHGERMRELISSREFSVDTGVNWGEEDKANDDLAALSLDTGDLVELGPAHRRPDTESEAARSADDELPAERTRIEANPLEKINELEQASRGKTPVPAGSVTGGPAPLPAPPLAGALPPGMPSSGRFPDLANLPTQISESDTPPPGGPPGATPRPGELHRPELAPTALGPVDPNIAMQQTQAELPRRPVITPAGSPAVAHPGALSATHDAVRISELQPQSAGAIPTGAMASAKGPVPERGSMYPVVHGGRPFNADLAPSTPPAAQRASLPPAQLAPHAANVMSPVGDQYPQVDWAAAAAQPAKAIPPWMLALLFAGALGVALLLTIIVVKIIR
ncbi:MAG TPA: serine/threonine-protein kinase [Kofleriaceae bacterium]|nr:serine/threonine-protein kinase [Kofleriaceae bacterium]